MPNDPLLIQGDGSPCVTVIMPAFNAARTICRAVDSVVAQHFTDWQLICVDDASTDGTVDTVAGYAGRLGARLTILHSATNGGPAQARNRGIAAARGAWVAVLDADDAWRPDRLGDLLALARGSDADIVCDNIVGYDDHRAQETEPLFKSLPRRLDIETAVAAEYQGRYNLGYLKPVVRRAFLEAHGLRYDEQLRTGEDLVFLLSCLAQGGRALCGDRPGYVYTTPVGQGSGKLSRSTTTTPRDADLAAALRSFAARCHAVLRPDEREAIDRRIAYLTAIAPLASFRHARLSHDWRTALKLFATRPQVRRQVWNSLRQGRGGIPRTEV